MGIVEDIRTKPNFRPINGQRTPMETDELIDEIMSAVYHAPIQYPDPVVQERIVKSNATNLVEDFLKEYREEVWSKFVDAHPEVVLE